MADASHFLLAGPPSAAPSSETSRVTPHPAANRIRTHRPRPHGHGSEAIRASARVLTRPDTSASRPSTAVGLRGPDCYECVLTTHRTGQLLGAHRLPLVTLLRISLGVRGDRAGSRQLRGDVGVSGLPVPAQNSARPSPLVSAMTGRNWAGSPSKRSGPAAAATAGAVSANQTRNRSAASR